MLLFDSDRDFIGVTCISEMFIARGRFLDVPDMIAPSNESISGVVETLA